MTAWDYENHPQFILGDRVELLEYIPLVLGTVTSVLDNGYFTVTADNFRPPSKTYRPEDILAFRRIRPGNPLYIPRQGAALPSTGVEAGSRHFVPASLDLQP